MRKIEQTIFTVEELKESALKTAHENYLENFEFFWADEWLNVIKKGLEAFNCELGRYSIDYSSATCSTAPVIDCNTHSDDVKGVRLRTWLINNFYSTIYPPKYYGRLVNTFKDGTPIPVSDKHRAGLRHVKRYSKVLTDGIGACDLTGYCGDINFLEPIKQFIEKPDNQTFEDLMEAAVYNTLKGIQQDYEWQTSMEYFKEEADQQEMEFYEDGERYFERSEAA